MRDQALVGNAADVKQVKKARITERDTREQAENDLLYLLTLPQFRRFVWALLDKTGVNASIWHPSAQIHYNSGRQDVGRELQDAIVHTNLEAYFQMLREAKERTE